MCSTWQTWPAWTPGDSRVEFLIGVLVASSVPVGLFVLYYVLFRLLQRRRLRQVTAHVAFLGEAPVVLPEPASYLTRIGRFPLRVDGVICLTSNRLIFFTLFGGRRELPTDHVLRAALDTPHCDPLVLWLWSDEYAEFRVRDPQRWRDVLGALRDGASRV